MSIRNTLVALALLTPISLGSTPAFAQGAATPGDADTIELRNGGVVRGSILEVVPDDSVTIVSAASGERKTIPWAELASYARGSERIDVAPREATAPAPAPTPAATDADEPASGPGIVRLHIEPSRPVNLQMFQVMSDMVAVAGNVTVVGMTYRPVCTSPCDQVIDGSKGHSFFFGGDRLTTSRRFTLTGHSGDVTAKVKPGRKGLFVGGIVMASVGPAVMMTGVTWLILQKFGGITDYDDMGNELPKPEPSVAGPAALMVVGGAMIAGGIVMAVLGRTRFKLSQRGLGVFRPLRFG